MKYWDIVRKFNQSFREATTDEEQDKSIRTYVEELTKHGYVLARHIQGPIKKEGPNGWGLRKKDNRVQSDPYSAYNWR
jgi:hypothetical protein